MKNLFSKLLVLALCLVAVFSLVACGENKSGDSNTGDQGQEQSTNSTQVNSTNSNGGANGSGSPSQSVVESWKSPVSMSFKNIVLKGEIDEEFPPATTETTIYLVGDSTVCEYTELKEKNTYYFMRNGFGMRLGEYLTDKAKIVNLAISGRSSKSFLKEKNYTTLKESIKAGDFLIIGFGHNDAKTDDNRYTDPTGATTDPTSFKYSLYENYVKIAQEKGATPILCTPIVRRAPNGTYSGSLIHQTKDSGKYKGGDYSKAIVELGQEKAVDVVDLTTLTKEYFTGMSSEQSQTFYAWYQTVNAIDNTHLNAYGAQVVARLFIESINLQTNNLLRGYIKDVLPEPTIDVLVPLEKAQ